mgnify:FL=1
MIKTIIALLALMPVLAEDEGVFISAAIIVGYGIFTAENQVRQKGFTDESPASDAVDGIRFIDITNKIPSEPKLGFGIEYLVNSKPVGRPISVTCVIKFPEPGLVQPHGRVYKESREKLTVKVGEPTFYGYAFDEPWEMVPGTWTFEVWHKKARLVRKKFTVLPPATQDSAESETAI